MKIHRRPPDFDDLRGRAADEAESLLNELPAELAARARALPLVFEGTPSEALVRSGIAPETLGLFIGAPFAEEPTGGPLPSEILLFLENLWAAAGGRDREFRAEVRRTLLHELGHYLGLDEGDLLERDLD